MSESMNDIRNVVIFMSDGVRWDSHPESIRKRGVTYRTVSSSLHTPTSIASMLSGEYLPGHNVRGFTEPFEDETITLLDAFPNQGKSDFKGNFNNEIYNFLLGRYDPVSLNEVEEPFSWFIRDPGGHAPYGEFDDDLRSNMSVDDYLKQHAGDSDQMWADYRRGINDSVERFEAHVLDTLRERGIEKETLVVFVSDHGQMLGEYGHVGESYPATPEIVYVPVTFIHPSLNTREADTLFRHVDLPDTIDGYMDANLDLGQTDGVDHTNTSNPPRYGLSLYDRPYPSFHGTFHYTLRSVWDTDGGHVFNESSTWDEMKLLVGFLTSIPAGRQLRKSKSLEGLRYLFRDQYSWGDPSMTVEEARHILDSVDIAADRSELDLDNVARENLEDLGYL